MASRSRSRQQRGSTTKKTTSRAQTSDLEPTPEELAEAAALKEVPASDEAKQAAVDARLESAPPRTAPATGSWYVCAQDKDGNAMVSEDPYSNAEAARAAVKTLPGRVQRNPVAVQAADRDAALAAYEALEDPSAVEQISTALPVQRASLLVTRTVPVEHTELLVSPTGLAHVSPDCRFVKGKDGVVRVPDADGELLTFMIEKGQGATWYGEEKEGEDTPTVKMTGHCAYCAAKQPEPVSA